MQGRQLEKLTERFVGLYQVKKNHLDKCHRTGFAK